MRTKESVEQEIRAVIAPNQPDEYFMLIAKAVATGSDCVRDRVGAVIVKGGRIIGTGFNRAPEGQPGCLETPCPRSLSGVPKNSPYDHGAGMCIAVHAEMNAMLDAGIRACPGATLYCTRKPCHACAPMVQSAYFARVVYPD